MRLLVVALAAALSLAGASAALAAATPAPAAAGAPSQPQSTTAVYGDWTLRCVMLSPAQQPGATATQAAPPTRHCELDQSIAVSGQQTPVAQIAVGTDVGDGTMNIVAALPIGLWLPGAASFKLGDADTPVPLAFKRCVPNACFASAALSDQLRTAMQTEKGPGRLTFEMAAGKDSNLPLSLNGFTAAFQALSQAGQ
jgi:invasion protein IalB